MLSNRYDSLHLKLNTALDYSKNTTITGCDNVFKHSLNTNGWVNAQRYHYATSGKYVKTSTIEASKRADAICNSVIRVDDQRIKFIVSKKKWHYFVNDIKEINIPSVEHHPTTSLDPLIDSRFHLKPDHYELLIISIFALATRYGNCKVRASLVSKYLWEHSVGIHRIEAISMKTFDHVLVVVNRSGDLTKPNTWGDAWIIDAWYKEGIIFHAKEFKQRILQIKRYAREQIKKFEAIGFRQSLVFPISDQDIGYSLWDINPKKDIYPSYSKHMKVEDYYTVLNGYPDDILQVIPDPRSQYVNTEIDSDLFEKKHEDKFITINDKDSDFSHSIEEDKLLNKTQRTYKNSAPLGFFSKPSNKIQFLNSEKRYTENVETKCCCLIL